MKSGSSHSTADQDTFLPIAVWYSGGKARAPMLSAINENSQADWRRDLAQIKDLGFNTVRTWVEWAHCEPQEGKYNFENLELLAKLAQDADLRFIIQLYVDSAPDWVGLKYPDGRYEAQSGDKISPQSAPGFCTDHSGVRSAVLNFISETAKVAVQYPNFHGWDLWSEPHIVNWAYINYIPDVQFCYCEHTCIRFRKWLQDKYQTLDRLNDAWYRNFTQWAEVEPPRFGTILSYTDFIDWKNFIYAKLSEDLGMRYAAVRTEDKDHVITSHAAVPSIFYSPYNGYGATDDFLMAEQVDYYGTSLYPKHNHPDRHWELWKFQVAVDFSRSANQCNGGFYVGELQAGRGTYGLNVGNPVTPADHRLWMWSALSRGARAINIYAYYPMSSGYESGGYGLIELDGGLTERAIKAGKTAQIIDQNKKILLEATPVKAEIALVYNPLAQMVGGEQRHGRGDMHMLSLFGYYRFFSGRNIPVDFIHRQDLEDGNFEQYKLIIVPYPLMLTKGAANGMIDFVSGGGYLVCEARPAWNDERGFAASEIPGMDLAQVFGVREKTVFMNDNVMMSVSNANHVLTKGLKTSDRLKGTYFAESFSRIESQNGNIIAEFEDGSPAVVVNSYGQGSALIIGSFIGMANHIKRNVNNEQLFANLLEWAHIDRPFFGSLDEQNIPLEIRLSRNENWFILFILNHDSSARNVTINLKVETDGRFSSRSLIKETSSEILARNKRLVLDTTVNARDVQVYVIHPQEDGE